jgi:putative transposase
MSNYRRLYLPGGTYFFTVVTHGRQPLFADDHTIEKLRSAFRYVKTRRPFEIIAAVILPDHLHCLWRLPDGDTDFSTRWQMIKTDFSRRVPAPINKNGSKSLWQPRYWEHCIRDDEDFGRHLDYIHYNPVKHGFAATPVEWKPSSIWRFVEIGWYETTWGASEPENIRGMECE